MTVHDTPVTDAEFLNNWSRWLNVVRSVATGRSSQIRLTDKDYTTAQHRLLDACHCAADASCTILDPTRRRVHALVAPWIKLETLKRAEPVVIAALWDSCEDVDRRLTNRTVPNGRAGARTVVAIVVLLLLGATAFTCGLTPSVVMEWLRDAFLTARAAIIGIAEAVWCGLVHIGLIGPGVPAMLRAPH